MSTAKQLQKNDPEGACQILLVCAVYQNYAGQLDEALESMGQIMTLAERYTLADELLWAGWGATAICVQRGDSEAAAENLQNLQTRLREQDEWVLANFIEVVEQSLRQRTLSADGDETDSTKDGQYGSLMNFTFDWLEEWGFSTRSDAPEFQAIISTGNRTDTFGAIPPQLHTSNQGWRLSWGRFKQILRGELKLQWVANGTHHRPKPEIQSTRTYYSHPKPIQPEAVPFPAPRTLVQDPPQSEPVNPTPLEGTTPEASLLVYCLGQFRVYKNDQLIDKWPGNKCKQVLKYLVVHRDTPVNQEILMEQFWPEMDAKGARRNLYQAVYNLRQALQSHEEDVSYVLTEDNHYRLNSELEIWVDSEAFKLHYQNAQSLLAASRQEQAMQEFEAAENLYQGEFLAEDRYEDWPLVHRENLKNAYLDTLSQLSQHFYTGGQFAMSIYYCQKILEEDNCREDVHRRVMLSYLNLDQPHLALRQYHTCVEALQEELDVPPMQATEELFKQIQQRRNT
ncbi:MAG: BTAD domain-containing putative transcriptional regulator [Anaerolineales bacterium]